MNRSIVVTGGASGIGAAIVSRLIDQGASVISIDLLPPKHTQAKFEACDLSSEQAINQLAGVLPDRLAGLICVAGVGPEAASPEQIMRINFLGLRHLVLQLMDRLQTSAGIVTVASSAGRDWAENQTAVAGVLGTEDFKSGLLWLAQNPGDWRANAYKFSKQCAAAFTYPAAVKAKAHDTRINCINPGITETPLSASFRRMLGAAQYDDIVRQSGRTGQPEDIAGLAVFLAGADAAWINGVEITVDGGYHARKIAI